MELIRDFEIMAAHGLPSAFLSEAPTISQISHRQVLTHRIYPGLAGLVPVGDEQVVVMFVDKLPEDENLEGVLSLTSGSDSDGEPVDKWVIEIESSADSWRFMTLNENICAPKPRVVMCQWKPSALQAAFTLHHEMIRALGQKGQRGFQLQVGSDIEVEAYSELAIASGYSSLAHPLEGLGLITQALENTGLRLAVGTDPNLQELPCDAIQAYSIQWHTAT